MSLSDEQNRLFDRFVDHLADGARPTRDTFLAFGSLGQLYRLMPSLQANKPDWAPVLREALNVRYAERWKKQRAGIVRGTPGLKAKLSVPADQIPKAWQRAIKEMTLARVQVDRGVLTIDDRVPPSRKVIAKLEYTVRQLAFAATDAGLKPALNMQCVRAFLLASKSRKTRPVTRRSRLKELMTFAQWLDEAAHEGIINAMRRHANQLARLAGRQRKRKEDWLIQNPIEVVDCWMIAEEMLQEALAAPSGSNARLDLALDALAIALAINVPLRIGDLHRLQIGNHLTRSFETSTWTIALRCEKMGNEYAAEMWPELTPFIDAVVLAGRPDTVLATRLREVDSQFLFSKHGRKFSELWISKVWYRHIGTGEHIIRTLWHEEALDDADTWMSLVLCGQEGGSRTARHYQVKQQKRLAGKRAKSLMQAARSRRRS